MPPAQPSPDANAPNVATMQVTRTERGWPGHYRGAQHCLFRRNTLLTCGTIRIVVSTVGAYHDDGRDEPIGAENTYYETKAFWARNVAPFEAETHREVPVASPWALCGVFAYPLGVEAHALADAQHERIVAEVMARLGESDDTSASLHKEIVHESR